MAARKDFSSISASNAVNWHQLHDIFNLIALPIVCFSNVRYLIFMEDVFLWTQYYLFASYLIADTIWVVMRPQSVASPSTIITHHLVCIIGWVIPHISDPSLSQWMSLGLLVEINTFFLIARRYWGRTTVLQILFYTSWVILRNIMFPIVLFFFFFKYIEYTALESQGKFINTGLFILIVMVFLNILNFSWSWDLFLKSTEQKQRC